MFSTNPGLLISTSLCKGEEKEKHHRRQSDIFFLVFFPFLALLYPGMCWIFIRVLHPNILLSILPYFSTLLLGFSSHCFFQISFLSFTLQLSLLFPLFSTVPLTPLQKRKRRKKKRKNELHFNNQNNSETMLLRSHLLPTHLPRQQMMGIPG